MLLLGFATSCSRLHASAKAHMHTLQQVQQQCSSAGGSRPVVSELTVSNMIHRLRRIFGTFELV